MANACVYFTLLILQIRDTNEIKQNGPQPYTEHGHSGEPEEVERRRLTMKAASSLKQLAGSLVDVLFDGFPHQDLKARALPVTEQRGICFFELAHIKLTLRSKQFLTLCDYQSRDNCWT